jgi:short-subunit dehydrogenase
MAQAEKPLVLVTGASSGIGLELARICAGDGYDLLIAADEGIQSAAEQLRTTGVQVTAVEADLSTTEGVDKVLDAARGRPIELLFANAGRGLGHAFLDQKFEDAMFVVNTNITGTIYLLHKVGREMKARRAGKILITGSIAGTIPGSFQAVYNGSKAFLDNFSVGWREELKDTGVSVTCLMPGVTDTEFFDRADLMDTKVGLDDHKADPADVARTGYDSLMKGEATVVHGLGNKAQVAMGKLMPDTAKAKQHRDMAEPGSGDQGSH